jgi:hypothetical protein
MAFDASKTPGTFGAPPPGAPQEVTVPGSERPTREQIQQARANEQELAPYAPKHLSDEAMAAMLGKTVAEIQAQKAAIAEGRHPQANLRQPQLVDPQGKPVTSGVKPPDVPRRPRGRPRHDGQPPIQRKQPTEAAEPVIESAPDSEADAPLAAIDSDSVAGDADLGGDAAIPESGAGQRQAPVPATAPYHPAASDTDSPSRGLPKAVADPGKKITGGFGDLGEAQYFPLTGLEAGVKAEDLLDKMHAQIKNDLRFSIAATYPRMSMELTLTVTAYGMEQTHQIRKVMVPYTRTPLEVAQENADEVVFVIVKDHQEFSKAGESLNPPDKTRMELGMEVPRKRAVSTPGGKMIVDLPTIGL